MKVDELLQQFDDGLRKLTVEYEIFFSGGKKHPPTNMRFRLDQIVKQLLEERLSFAQRFRFNQLTAKFSVHKDLWRRQTQEKEEKGLLRPEKELETLISRPALEERENKDYFSQPIADPEKETPKVLRLYEELQTMRVRNGEKKIALDGNQFRAMLSEKLQGLKEKQKCQAVEFIIRMDPETHKVKFVARPLVATSSPPS